jgi:hypothetical protein
MRITVRYPVTVCHGDDCTIRLCIPVPVIVSITVCIGISGGRAHDMRLGVALCVPVTINDTIGIRHTVGDGHAMRFRPRRVGSGMAKARSLVLQRTELRSAASLPGT